MNTAGLDLSLTSTGYSILGVTGSINGSKLRGPERLVVVRDTIRSLLSELSSPMVAIEGYSFGSKNSQAHATGELGGVVRVMLHESGIPYVEIPPTCRSKFATGKGNAGKSEVVSAISAKTGIIWTGSGADDMCDAWILEEMIRVKLGIGQYDWPKLNMEALDKIDWTSFNL